METVFYKTIKAPSQGNYKEKGSKFLSFAFPVSSESEVKEYLQKLRKEYYDATHHVYAYRIGSDKKFFRCSDDGEPSNSSGPPVLGQIQSFDLTNILIVVVRYFGGTKLGVSGLIHAYRSAAADAIRNAEIVETIDKKIIIVSFPYQNIGEVMKIIKNEGLEIQNSFFENISSIKVSIPIFDIERITNKLLTIEGVRTFQE